MSHLLDGDRVRPPESMNFGGLDVCFDERVLRPRPWTLDQAEWAAALLPTGPAGRVLELCAGVGHLGLRAVSGTSRELVLVDRNPVACDFARINAAAAHMADRVEVREGLMESVVEASEEFALIIADPPWVPSRDTARFRDDPLVAIDGGTDGLELAKVCCDLVAAHLMDRGSALLQLGTSAQADAIRAYVSEHPAWNLDIAELRTYPRGVVLRLVRGRAPFTGDGAGAG